MINEIWAMILAIATIWFGGLVLSVVLPIVFVKVFNIKANLWMLALFCGLAWVVGTYIWYKL